ncbi:MAG: hypothetical protein UX45_C0029G0014 [Candidatus Uhrbacteria bacterium GW2011_GWF2_46_218]|uniref:Uncharacterized protein n=1 Tax=Candidatus Uhrbacteria bacterium GW2011_GWF2_46_218 TaxID=1619001 RepID=A0A0G1SD65_9BACT|nr:MAG: hypothetical protein UX45_C0029G0014 [Candidatus Uhrbacteria bacterium GW2011_GWF2_46_218]
MVVFMNDFSRPTPESSPSATPAEAVPPVAGPPDTEVRAQCTSEILGEEAIMDSVSSVRDSLPEQYHAHFETLRQEIIDFTKAHGIPKESLGSPDLLREATSKLSIRFEYLLKNREPKKEDYTEALEYAEEFYHLREQYDFQVKFLEQVGILEGDAIVGIDGKTYPIPTLEQIASRLFEHRETLETKRDQGFTKLLLVPFGMSLRDLIGTFSFFASLYSEAHPDFKLDRYKVIKLYGVWNTDHFQLSYFPKLEEKHRGYFKREILDDSFQDLSSFLGWRVHLFQPSNPSDSYSPGFAHIPRQGKGIPQGDLVFRPPLEAGKSLNEYLSILQKARGDKDSPYHGETGLTPEDWIMAFMIHLSETGKPLDDVLSEKESACCFSEVFSSFETIMEGRWDQSSLQVILDHDILRDKNLQVGIRTSMII